MQYQLFGDVFIKKGNEDPDVLEGFRKTFFAITGELAMMVVRTHHLHAGNTDYTSTTNVETLNKLRYICDIHS